MSKDALARQIDEASLPWKACIHQHPGIPDTVCIKDVNGQEIVHWSGFDGVPGTKAQIRSRARLIVRAVNALVVE